MSATIDTEHGTRNTEHGTRNTDKYITSLTREELSSKHITSLALGQVRVLHIKQFVGHEACNVLSKNSLDLGYGSYLNVPSVRKIGMAYYETEGRRDLIEAYFQTAGKNIEALRRACEPVGSPLDLLRCKLDEIWSAGAQLQTLDGKKMFIGLSRMVEPGTTFLAHHDIFQDDAPDAIEARSLVAQFAANVYIQMPKKGGELLMWHKNMSTTEFNQKRQGNYGIRIENLAEPDLVIKPSPGDLLIFDSRKLHAVASPQDESRLAFSCFVGYRGTDKPLTFWS
jgi:hypothetical protein